MKDLVTDLINRLQSQASSEANHKYHCDDDSAKAKVCLEQHFRSPASWTVMLRSYRRTLKLLQHTAADGGVDARRGAKDL